MKRIVEGLDRGQSTLFPASLDDYVTETPIVLRTCGFSRIQDPLWRQLTATPTLAD